MHQFEAQVRAKWSNYLRYLPASIKTKPFKFQRTKLNGNSESKWSFPQRTYWLTLLAWGGLNVPALCGKNYGDHGNGPTTLVFTDFSSNEVSYHMQKEFWRYLERFCFHRHFVSNFLEILVFENVENPEILENLENFFF